MLVVVKVGAGWVIEPRVNVLASTVSECRWLFG